MDKPEIAIFSSKALIPIAEAIPTTLLTSERVIKKVVDFWGGGGEKPFRDALVRREIASFSRALTDILTEEQLADSVKVISLAEFNHLP